MGARTKFLIGIIAFVMTSCEWGGPKIYYVDNVKLFNEFDMTIEHQEKLKQLSNLRIQELDSLKTTIEAQARLLSEEENGKSEAYRQFERMRQHYLQKEQQYREEEARVTQTYDDQIKTQLNQLVSDFGKEKEYDFILGVDGTGNIMYAKEDHDLTKEIVQFCNSTYNGNIN